VEDIKTRRLGWAGHIIRMEEERIPNRVLNGNFHTTRPVGRPRTRWVDVVQRDALQLLGIRGWRSKAANRDEWRHLMREANARKGLWCHIWMDGNVKNMLSTLYAHPLLKHHIPTSQQCLNSSF
jgi:hypothetical protein